jgi:hypothetical protein
MMRQRREDNPWRYVLRLKVKLQRILRMGGYPASFEMGRRISSSEINTSTRTGMKTLLFIAGEAGMIFMLLTSLLCRVEKLRGDPNSDASCFECPWISRLQVGFVLRVASRRLG